MLILDEPTNHLDVDAREALIQAINDYSGAVILISHDRHMVELTADRLVLVDGGTAKEYSGSMDDYIDFVLGRNQPKKDAKKSAPKPKKKPVSTGKDQAKERFIKSELEKAEKAMARIEREVAQLDQSMVELNSSPTAETGAKMEQLLAARAKAVEKLSEAEAIWLTAGEKLEAFSA